MNFDAVFGVPESWKNENISDRSPCLLCDVAKLQMGNPYYMNEKCPCAKLARWHEQVIMKLNWLEHREERERNSKRPLPFWQAMDVRGAVWFEVHNGELLTVVFDGRYARRNGMLCAVFRSLCRGSSVRTLYASLKLYGRSWRLWAVAPTTKEREAAGWRKRT